MMPFDLLFPEIARQEAGAIYAYRETRLPDGTYWFREFYCCTAGCNCRQVELRIQRMDDYQQVACIHYGFDPAGGPAESDRCICLDPASPQSTLARILLDLVRHFFTLEPEYVDDLKRHYALWSQVVDDPLHPLQGLIGAYHRTGSTVPAIGVPSREH